MRLIIRLTKNTQIIPFNYQELLTGCIHKWLGRDNIEHGTVSLYSFSWLQNTEITKSGIWLKNDAYFTLSFFDDEPMKRVLKKILTTPEMFCGSKVFDIQLQPTPNFSERERFLLSSPVLLKRKEKDKDKERHYTFEDKQSEEIMTETLKTKLKSAGLDYGAFNIYWDNNYAIPKTKIVTYKGIGNRVSLCPIIIEGSPELIGFAWAVGLGNSTGIGFGSLK